MQRQVNLCTRCAGVLSDRYFLQRLTVGASGSVRCEFCGRLRRGSRYAVTDKWEERQDAKGCR